ILLLSLTLQSFYYNIMAMEYQFYLPEYLSKCVNIDETSFQCDGQCALIEKIKDSEERQGQKNLLIYEYNTFYLHKEDCQFRIDRTVEIPHKRVFSAYRVVYSFNFVHSLFRPPIEGLSGNRYS